MLPTNRPPTHPGDLLLKEFLEPLGVSQVEAAKRIHACGCDLYSCHLDAMQYRAFVQSVSRSPSS
jgi:hypothetical protein